MRQFFLLLAALSFLLSCRNELHDAIADQLAAYPESRVQDIYKSFCQDALGPEHLIPDPEAARRYLRSELAEYRSDLDSGKYTVPEVCYVPTGDQGNYIRVDLSVVLDSLLTEEALLEAFVRSANEGRQMTEEEWVGKWQKISELLRRDFPDIPDEEADLRQLDSLIAEGHLIFHHSSAFSAAYHPHYRIIARHCLDFPGQ